MSGVSPSSRAASRGAVYVEFLVAFLPLLVFFECLVQLAGLVGARFVVHHAAYAAARAASVVLYDDPKHYDDLAVGEASGKRREAVERAAAMPLKAVRSIVDFKVTFPSSAGANDDRASLLPDDLVRVRVEAKYRCFVPLASHLVCGVLSGARTLTAEAAMPGQGAEYQYPASDVPSGLSGI